MEHKETEEIAMKKYTDMSLQERQAEYAAVQAECEKLKAEGWEDYIHETTGLILDAYFSGTKLQWMLDAIPGARRRAGRGGRAAWYAAGVGRRGAAARGAGRCGRGRRAAGLFRSVGKARAVAVRAVTRHHPGVPDFNTDKGKRGDELKITT